MSVYKGPLNGFRGFGLEKDVRAVDIQAISKQLLPYITSNNFPPPHLSGKGGGIAYDVTTDRPYYSDGFGWIPIGTGAPGTVKSFSFVKNGDQNIPISINTVVTPWEITSSDTYHDDTIGWDLTTGIYTASTDTILTVYANITWKSGISNLGNRILRVQHMKLGIPIWNTVKEMSTQADPDVNINTTQECQIHLKISQGDGVRISVFHDSIVPLIISGGSETSVAGFSVITN